jgi:hypothetical protein
MFQGQPLPQISCNVHIDTSSSSSSSSSPMKPSSRNLRISVRTPPEEGQASHSEPPTDSPAIPALRWSEKQSSTATILEEKGNKEFEKRRQFQQQQQPRNGDISEQEGVSDQTVDQFQVFPQSSSQLLLLTPASPALFGPIVTTYGLRGLSPVLANPRSACSYIQPPPVGSQYVLVAIRGGCTFAQKALIAQKSGFSALLVLDLLSNDDFAAVGGEADFMMADDGNAPQSPQQPNDPSGSYSLPSQGVGSFVTIPSALVSGESAKALSLTFLRRGQGTLEMMIDEALSIKEHGWQVPSSSSSSSSMGTPPSSPEHTHTLVIHPNIEFFSSYQTSIFGDVLFNEEATIQQPLFPLPSLVAHHSKVIGEAFSHAFETLPNESQRGEKFRSLYPNPFVDLLT